MRQFRFLTRTVVLAALIAAPLLGATTAYAATQTHATAVVTVADTTTVTPSDTPWGP